MGVQVVFSKVHFEKQLVEAGGNLVVLEFNSKFCNACKTTEKKVLDLANLYPHIAFIKIDTDNHHDISSQYDVKFLPTYLFLKNGEKVHRMDYAQPKELEETVLKYK